jgi:hypothetical protein
MDISLGLFANKVVIVIIQHPYNLKEPLKKFCLRYFQHNPAGNCAADLASVLSAIEDFSNINESRQLVNIIKFHKPLYQPVAIDSTEYRNWDIWMQNILRYICGYLIGKCLHKHNCAVCFEYATACGNLSQDTLFCYFKAYDDDIPFGQLKMPHESFAHYAAQLENIFITKIPNIAILAQPGLNMKNDMIHLEFQHPCQHFPKDYLVSLYVRLRIFHTLKRHNRAQKSLPKKERRTIIFTHL